MEPLKSQLSLRSLDSKGRPAGTGRPFPTPQLGVAFAEALARDPAGTMAYGVAERDAARPARELEEEVQARIDHRSQRLAREREAQSDPARRERAADLRERASSAERRGAQEPGARRAVARERHSEEPGEAPVATPSPTPPPATGSAPTGAGASPEPAPGLEPAGMPLTALPVDADGAAAVAQGLPSAALAGAAPAASSAAGANAHSASGAPEPIGAAGGAERDLRALSLRRTTAVDGRPAPTASDLERAESVLRQIRVHLTPGLRQATIRLQPEELGRVTIRLRVDADGIRATVRAETPEALAVLEKHVPELRALFEQQGFAGADIDLGLAEGGERGGSRTSGERERRASARAERPAESETIPLARALGLSAGLDLWA